MIILISSKKLGVYKVMRNTVHIYLILKLQSELPTIEKQDKIRLEKEIKTRNFHVEQIAVIPEIIDFFNFLMMSGPISSLWTRIMSS